MADASTPDNTIFYINCKGPNPPREQIPSPSKTENYYHESLERGRELEKSIGDAADWAKKIQKDLNEKITLWLKLQVLGTDGQLPDSIRPAKYAKAVIDFIKEMKKLMDEVVAVISAMIKIAQMIIAMINRFKAMIQSILNALAKLIAAICNWNLPTLPSIPNLFGNLVWGFNGFNIGKVGKITFDANFAFSHCQIKKPSFNVLSNYPSQVTGSDGLVYGQQLFNPPLGGIIATPTNLKDQYFAAAYLNPDRNYTPIFVPSFNQNTDMVGSLPKASTIASNYSLSPIDYAQNAISLISNLTPFIPKTTDADYDSIDEPNDPFITTDITPATTLRRQALQTGFGSYVNLGQVVDSGYDLNLTSVWVLYLSRSLSARGGQWIAEFKDLYNQIILPTVTQLQTTNVPYNSFGGTTKSSPTSLPLIDHFITITDAGTLNNLYWRLSFIEASLLGYPRNQRWDSYANGFLSTVTGSDLDFSIIPISAETTPIVLSSNGLATYPQQILVPISHLSLVTQAIAVGVQSIADHPEWRTANSQFRYIYDQFANATEVDRYSQFWREWTSNFNASLISEVNNRTLNYWQSIDSQVNPLGDSTLSNYIRIDSQTRNSSWAPGDGLLNLPKELYADTTPNWQPNNSNNGWSGEAFDATVFLARPDIQALPVTTQMAMTDLNKAYASILVYQQQALEAMNTQLTSVQNAITATSTYSGFQVESTATMTLSGGKTLPLTLPSVQFDYTNNVTSPTSFTIQTAGDYSIAGAITTGTSLTPSVIEVDMIVNGVTALSASSDKTINSSTINLSGTVTLAVGDIITFQVTNNGSSSIDILNSIISCMAYIAASSNVNIVVTEPGYPIGVDSLSAATAVEINDNGQIIPIHPETNTAITPWFDGVTLTSGTLNQTVAISLIYGTTYTIPDAHFTEGSNLYIGANGVLTEDFSAVQSSCRWIIGVGKAVSGTEFIYEPQLPMDSQSGGGGGGSYLVPSFSSFFIDSQSSSLEVGATSNANPTFVWTIANASNTSPNTIDISDITASIVLATGISTTSPHVSTYGGVTKTSISSETFSITGTNTHGSPFSGSFTISWYDRVYYGESATDPLNASGITGLRASGLQPSFAGVYSFLASPSEYKYLCFPVSFGTPSSFKDQSTNLNVPFNNPYVVTVTNTYGVVITYNVFRTFYPIGGAISVVVA